MKWRHHSPSDVWGGCSMRHSSLTRLPVGRKIKCSFILWLALYFVFLLKQCPLKKLELTRELTLKSFSFQLNLKSFWVVGWVPWLMLLGIIVKFFNPFQDWCGKVYLYQNSTPVLLPPLPIVPNTPFMPRLLVISLLSPINFVKAVCDPVKENG